jgi:hypothetical protein
MVDMRQAVRVAQALLAILVAISMLFAPLAAAWAMPCHDFDAHQAVAAVSTQFKAASGHLGHQHASHAIDHKACCGSACGFCAALIESASLAALDLIATNQRHQQNDSAVSGLALLPALDPPRSQV